MNRRMLVTFAVCVAMFAVTSTSSAGDLVIPAAWEGVWDLTNTTRLCGTGGGTVETEADTLCAGAPLFVPEPGDPVPDCTGTVTDTEVDVVCTFTQDIKQIPGCTATFTVTLRGTRTGETYSATESVAVSYTVECGQPDFCEETVTTATRTTSDPDCPASPVQSMTWSMIKSSYR